MARQRAEEAATQLQTDLVESQRRARTLKQEIVRLAQTTRHLRERAIRSGKQMTEALSALHKLREPIPVHPPGLHVHPPLLTRTPPRGNLKFPLRITQLHTKFSRQFKGLHMILSNLKSFNIAVSAPSSLHMKRCKQACIRLDGRGCDSTSTSLPSTSLPSTSLLFTLLPFTSCPCETSIPIPTPISPLLHSLL